MGMLPRVHLRRFDHARSFSDGLSICIRASVADDIKQTCIGFLICNVFRQLDIHGTRSFFHRNTECIPDNRRNIATIYNLL